MIKVIGFKRVIVLVVLLAINAVLAAAIYMYMAPAQIKAERSLRTVRSQLNTVQSDIQRMQLEFEQLDQQQEQFYALVADGFLTAQERSEAKNLFSEIQNESKVIAAVVNVKPGFIEENEEASKAKHKVLRSQIDVDIKAFDDNDIYKYIEVVKDKFPGHISLEGVTIKRTRDISAPVLRAIATGANPELIDAKIMLLWRTLIPENQVIADPNDGGR